MISRVRCSYEYGSSFSLRLMTVVRWILLFSVQQAEVVLVNVDVFPRQTSTAHVWSCCEDAEASNLADQACSSLVRQRHTGWVQRMNYSLPWAQTLCRETNIQQHLCVWNPLPFNHQVPFPGGKPQPGVTPMALSQNCCNVARMTESYGGNLVRCAPTGLWTLGT